MGTHLLRIVAGLVGLLGLLLIAALAIVPPYFDNRMNPVEPHEPYEISEEARELHATIPVADLHADTMLWSRNILKRNDRGHVDLPRMREGGMFLQVFTAVTQSPQGQNYESNETDTSDNITTLAIAQRWPRRTWDSRTERAIYQAEKLAAFAEEGQAVRLVRTCQDLADRLLFERARRMTEVNGPTNDAGAEDEFVIDTDFWPTDCERRPRPPSEIGPRGYKDVPEVAAILGTEGSHALDGELSNIDRLYDVGYRVMGLHHFFDNRLGGSLHGTSGAGLSQFGRDAVTRMRELDIVIDLAHSSEQVGYDALAMGAGPFIVSHTGFNGHCESPRNISDELMAAIAEDGGLIGVGFWSDVICGTTAASVADAIIYGVEKFGVEHVALGSDFDGTVATFGDASEMAAITQALMDRGMPEEHIRLVMGGNTVRFFLENLPAE